MRKPWLSARAFFVLVWGQSGQMRSLSSFGSDGLGLRLAQQAMDEVDRLRGEIAGISSGEDRIDVSTSKELIVRSDS